MAPRREEPPDPPITEWCDDCEARVIVDSPTTHREECPKYQPPPPPPCSFCNPRPREHKRVGTVFCEDHGPEGLAAHERAVEEAVYEMGLRYEEANND